MKLRFDVDQAEAFRRGVDCPKSIVTVEVDPTKVSPEDRNLIADRMEGIDVCELNETGKKLYFYSKVKDPIHNLLIDKRTPARVRAKLPTFQALMEAIREENQKLQSAVESSGAGKQPQIVVEDLLGSEPAEQSTKTGSNKRRTA